MDYKNPTSHLKKMFYDDQFFSLKLLFPEDFFFYHDKLEKYQEFEAFDSVGPAGS